MARVELIPPQGEGLPPLGVEEIAAAIELTYSADIVGKAKALAARLRRSLATGKPAELAGQAAHVVSFLNEALLAALPSGAARSDPSQLVARVTEVPPFRSWLEKIFGGPTSPPADAAASGKAEALASALLWHEIDAQREGGRAPDAVTLFRQLHAMGAVEAPYRKESTEAVIAREGDRLRALRIAAPNDEQLCAAVSIRPDQETAFDAAFVQGRADTSDVAKYVTLVGGCKDEELLSYLHFRALSDATNAIITFQNLADGLAVEERERASSGSARMRTKRSHSAKTKKEIVSRALLHYNFTYSNQPLIEIFEPSIGHKDTVEGPSESIARRLAMLDRYTTENPGAPISGYVSEIFPELQHSGRGAELSREQSPVPLTRAPMNWSTHRIISDSPVSFIRRVYAPWLGHGLTRGDIAHLDLPLYRALAQWLKSNELPSDLDLPTREERNDRLIAKLEETGEISVPGTDGTERLKELQRLVGAMRRREQFRSR